MTPRHRSIVALVLAALLLAGCASDGPPPASAPGGGGSSTSVAPVPATGPPGTTATTEPAADIVDAACAGTLEVATVGRVATDAGAELSGIVASRDHVGTYWVHNDSGSGAEVHALTEEGALLATYDLGTDAIDWEDIAIGSAADGDGWSLLIGDIGDNDEARSSVQLLRFDEPVVDAATPAPPTGGAQAVSGLATVDLTYPDHPHNAEALLVDPDTGQVVIITKEIIGPAQVFVADADSIVDGAEVALTAAGSVDFGGGGLAAWVTAADVSPDGAAIAVRTYGGVHLFARASGQSVAEALARPPCAGPTPLEIQGEAVAFTADGQSYLTVSEGAEALVHRTS